jgi:uncharacterized membrane protein YtjA (UPF0391 family)
MYRMALGLGFVCLIMALIAGLLGFGGIAGYSWEGVRIFFFTFLVLGVAAIVGGLFVRRRRSFWEG